MNIDKFPYLRQAELLLQILPFIMKCDCFALKGGSAINFFVRDLPRLSIDIDLTYIPVEGRDTTVHNISDSLKLISDEITRFSRNVKVFSKKPVNSDLWQGLIIHREGAVVKVEPNLIIRGTVFPCEIRQLTPAAAKTFEMAMSVKILSLADLYGGKICAALDRQHPRDLFDIKLLFEKEGLTESIRKAFILYLISHNRPIHELLNPRFNDFKHIFDNEFSGMTIIDVTFDELVETRIDLISKIKSELTSKEKKFILSVKEKKPDWGLIGIEGVGDLPAVKWKLLNLEKMPQTKYVKALAHLEKVLGM
jgi:predicted nucleotidyltransferase component of viral defense system